MASRPISAKEDCIINENKLLLGKQKVQPSQRGSNILLRRRPTQSYASKETTCQANPVRHQKEQPSSKYIYSTSSKQIEMFVID